MSVLLHQRPAGPPPSESLTFKLRASLRGAGHVNVEHLLVGRWWRGRWAKDLVRLVFRRVLLLWLV